MKILFLSQSTSIHGGVERWLSDLILGLVSHGIDVSLALADGLRFHHAQDYIDAHPELSGLDIHLIDGKLGVPGQRRRFISSLIAQLKPDIIVPVLLQDGLEVAIERKNRGDDLRIVYPVHENDVWVYSVAEKYKNEIDLLVSVNKLFLRLLESDFNWPTERLAHIRCGAYQPKTNSEHVKDGVLQIGYCGKIHDMQKRATDIATLCQILDLENIAYKFSIAGAGTGENLLRERLNKQILTGRVIFLGQLSLEKLYETFYPKLDVLFVPSYWETGPIVAWEAMIHGAVVLSSRYRGSQCENILKDMETALLFPIGDMRTAAQQAARFNKDRALLRRLGANGKSLAEKKLTVDRMVEKWSDAMQQVLKRPPLVSEMRHQDNSGVFNEFNQLVETWARTILRRPVFHGSSHLEWPRYLPGHCSNEEVTSFDTKLWEVEKQCSGE